MGVRDPGARCRWERGRTLGIVPTAQCRGRADLVCGTGTGTGQAKVEG